MKIRIYGSIVYWIKLNLKLHTYTEYLNKIKHDIQFYYIKELRL